MSIYHKHHIIPKHMGGSDDPSNLIELTIEEHAEAHRKLWEDLGHQEDYIAWRCLTGQITNQEATLEAIRLARYRSRGVKKKPLSEETKKNISNAKKGKTISYPKNRKSRSSEDKKKISEKMMGERIISSVKNTQKKRKKKLKPQWLYRPEKT